MGLISRPSIWDSSCSMPGFKVRHANYFRMDFCFERGPHLSKHLEAISKSCSFLAAEREQRRSAIRAEGCTA